MLINERKPLGTDPYLESDLLERELENGVIIEQDGDSVSTSVRAKRTSHRPAVEPDKTVQFFVSSGSR
jgi:hypothetical protein